LRLRNADSTLPHLWPTGSSWVPPSITARYFSSCPSDSISRWTPCPPKYYKQWLQVRLGCIQLSPLVAVGIPIARYPPHRAVLARLTHTVLTSDTWRQSVQWDTGVGHRQLGAGLRVAPGTGSRTSGASGSVDESDAATSEARGSGIAPGSSHCQEQRGTGNILGPPAAAIWSSPPEGHAVAFPAQPGFASASLLDAC